MVVHEPPNSAQRRILIVEAKLPGQDDVGTYIRQSIYKAFGYAYDFRNLWSSDQRLRVVLFVPNEVAPSWQKLQEAGAEVAIVSARQPEELTRAFEEAFEIKIHRSWSGHRAKISFLQPLPCQVAFHCRNETFSKPKLGNSGTS